MPPRPVIALITDFGVSDPYVGVMKAVIADIAPEARLLDITHGIEPHAIDLAAFVLAGSCRFYPVGTIFVAVVDPGVGGDRQILGLKAGPYFFLAPDNGLLDPTRELLGPGRLVTVTERRFFRSSVSRTFHGRDIFAPVAAHLANGTDPSELGPATDQMVTLDAAQPTRSGDRLTGTILYIDRFGNAITNLLEARVEDHLQGTDLTQAKLELPGGDVRGIRNSYAEVASGEALAIVGSFGLLEIALNQGSAAEAFQLQRGDAVCVCRP